jgi:hypothetical protein
VKTETTEHKLIEVGNYIQGRSTAADVLRQCLMDAYALLERKEMYERLDKCADKPTALKVTVTLLSQELR